MEVLRNIHVTSPFGPRKHPITNKKGFHSGVDLRANYEDAYAIAPGTVYRVDEYSKGIGKYLIIDHGTFLAVYGHLSEVCVRVGDKVETGDVVAVTGNSGASDGAHLHLEIRTPLPSYEWNKLLSGMYEGAVDPIEFMSNLKNEHWAEKHYRSLNKKGIKIQEKRFDDMITRGEVFAIIDRLTDKEG